MDNITIKSSDLNCILSRNKTFKYRYLKRSVIYNGVIKAIKYGRIKRQYPYSL